MKERTVVSPRIALERRLASSTFPFRVIVALFSRLPHRILFSTSFALLRSSIDSEFQPSATEICRRQSQRHAALSGDRRTKTELSLVFQRASNPSGRQTSRDETERKETFDQSNSSWMIEPSIFLFSFLDLDRRRRSIHLSGDERRRLDRHHLRYRRNK